MMRLILILTVSSLVVAGNAVLAQSQTLAQTIGVFAFPTEGQEATQQSMDEADCYSWAVQATGTDPFELAQQAQAIETQAAQAMEDAQEAGKGSAVGGAAAGAAGGALIGGIFGSSAGRGAAIGAATGALVGGGRRRGAQQQATAQVEQQTAQAKAFTEEQVQNFKKAFSTCLEAKDYIAKY